MEAIRGEVQHIKPQVPCLLRSINTDLITNIFLCVGGTFYIEGVATMYCVLTSSDPGTGRDVDATQS